MQNLPGNTAKVSVVDYYSLFNFLSESWILVVVEDL